MEDKNYKNLVNLLKIFKNRPHHLAKYLLDNDALSDKFYNKISNSLLLKDIKSANMKFSNISEMNDYFTSLIENTPDHSNEELTKKLNADLEECLKCEDYEGAILIRNYMNLNNIERL